MASSIIFAQQEDKTLIKKQSGELTGDRAAFIKQYNGNGNENFLNSRNQSSTGASLLKNGDYKKNDLSKIRQINSDKTFNQTVNSRQYSKQATNKPSNQSRNNSDHLYIEQFGKDNVAKIQEKNNSYAGQYGDKNQAEVKAKNGTNNQSKILQTEDRNSVRINQQNDGHSAIINQYKGDNKAKISQKGSQNWVDVDQSKGSELDIRQSGSKNVVRGTRSSWAESLNGSILEIEQYGTNNQVDLQQNGSRIDLKQKGLNNKTTIIQK